MRLANYRLSVLTVASLVALAGCSQGGGAKEVDQGMPAEIVVSVPLDTSGPIGPVVEVGLSEREGIRVAAKEINESNLLGDSKIVLVEHDTAANKDEAIKAIMKDIDAGVDAIVGFTLSPSFAAAAPTAQRAGIPVVAVGLAGEGVEDVGDLVFRTYPNVAESVYPESDTSFAKGLGAKTAAMLYVSDNDTAVSINAARKAAMEAAGIDVVESTAIGAQDTDLRAALTKVKAADPDIVFMSPTPGQIPALAIQAEEVGLDAQLVMIDGTQTPAVLEAAGGALECTLFTALWSATSKAGNNAHFIKEFDARSERTPDTFAAAAYDALWVLATAIKDAGTVESGALRDALLAIADHEGALGTYDYTGGSGAPNLPGTQMVIENGKAIEFAASTQCAR